MKRLSASRLQLASRCTYSFRRIASGDEPPEPSEPNEGAANGTAVHAQIEEHLATGKPLVGGLPEVDSWAVRWLAERREVVSEARLTPTELSALGMRHTPAQLYVEQAFAYDPVARRVRMGPTGLVQPGVERPQRAHRDYDFATDDGRWTVVGTADLVIVTGDAIEVWDWKTGRSWVPHPSRNLQLRALAVMAAQLWKKKRARVGIAKLAETPEESWISLHEMDGFELNIAAEELLGIATRLQEDGRAVPGAWCRDHYCSLFGRCPATRGALAVVAGSELPGERLTLPIKSAEEASRWYHVWRAAEAQVSALGVALKTWADENGAIVVGDGKGYGKAPGSRETIDLSVHGAVEVLQAHLPETWREAVSFSATQTSIKAAVSSATLAEQTATGKRVPVAPKLRQVLSALRDAGAMASREFTTYREFDLESAGDEPTPAPALPPAPAGT